MHILISITSHTIRDIISISMVDWKRLLYLLHVFWCFMWLLFLKALIRLTFKNLSIFFSDFGSIFSTLLPGTMAKLEPPEGCSFLDGLEVRVAFGSVWKQSLSELSGGQRSLLALSLILALLLFKPAPLYILDEVLNSSKWFDIPSIILLLLD